MRNMDNWKHGIIRKYESLENIEYQEKYETPWTSWTYEDHENREHLENVTILKDMKTPETQWITTPMWGARASRHGARTQALGVIIWDRKYEFNTPIS